MVGTTEPVSGGSVATEAEVARGRFGFTISCDEAGSDRGDRPKCARWRSTAAIVAAVITSTIICCIEGGRINTIKGCVRSTRNYSGGRYVYTRLTAGVLSEKGRPRGQLFC